MARPFTADDTDDLVHLLAAVFANGDPPAVAVGLTPSEMEPVVRLLCPRSATVGHSMVAHSSETGEMVGALLAEDSATPPHEVDVPLSPKFEPIFDILGQLHAEYRAGRPVRQGESLHLFLLGVAPGHTRQGIADMLLTMSLLSGAVKGYRVAVTEATSLASQHVFRRHGFVERVRRSYADHRLRGRACFASIADQGGPILMDAVLGQPSPEADAAELSRSG